jgi:predicted anti-sigma-YlaC factor YlaD
MTCAELYDRLTDFVDGTLRGDVCDEVQRHLQECADCGAVRQDLEDLARLCRQTAAKPTTMPDVVRHRIEVLLAAEDAPRHPAS